jgi:23S rRNA maturation-related 3'-5' exoribonuclease YhaM
MQNACDQNRKYWRVDEAASPQQAKLNLNSEDQSEEIENKTLLIEDETLSQKIIEHVSRQRRS